MSQHDFNIANQTASATRVDLNNALGALASLSSGTTAPTTTFANMLWYETSTNWLWVRNEADSAWIRFAYFDQATGIASVLDDTKVVNTSGTQTGLLGDQSTATWQAGTGTTQSLVSPANVKAAILALAPSSVPTTAQVATATAGIAAGAIGSYMAAAGPGNQQAAFGATISGTVLRPTSFLGISGSLQGGTWRSMGNLSADQNGNSTLFLRIS